MQRRQNSKPIWIRNWEHLIAELVYDKRITIWKQLSAPDILGAESLLTNSTPKLRKMMRRKES